MSLPATKFGRVVLMVRGGSAGVASAVDFYQNALGLAVSRHTDEWAELHCGCGGSNQLNNNNSASSFKLNIKAVDSEAQLSVGYAPILSFDVEDMDSVVARSVQMGANLDGPILYPAHGKVAAIRTPDGHMIGLYEPALGL
mmetsp:Transcript_18510/g.22673  ORF Transcript_18510/g.22673 Transcript_18510/m.22673 type:complete len:141 (+) Transcript_18510:154-576(+)|eukprot:CAMPEP_0194386858 /NCGR_PEP_ID=MMETSP0174-20130528/88787_1 /TAXON_ID=216777 /ORGANISM="Proboscia alata, Strain PI-D3" /LENGTH=140 /DNA_ID=CAMNT_0039176453 /DNA_START=56 /DNA_END=478 /DNA_ORIENTATION=-